MKKLFLLPLIALGAVINSCGPVETSVDVGQYSNVVVYSSGGAVTDYSKITISGDMSTGYYSIKFSDFRLQPDGNLCEASVSGLTQYLKDDTDINGEEQALYTFFKTDDNTNSQGDVAIKSLNFGWLSTVYWGTFIADENQVWCLPRRVQTYANRNYITDSNGDTDQDISTCPRYDLNLSVNDIQNSKLTVNATNVVYPTPETSTGSEKTFKFQSMVWNELPIIFNRTGFSVAKTDFSPTTDGQQGKFEITDFTLTFDVSYEGTRQATFDITHVESGKKIHVVTQLYYNRATI